MHEMILCKLGEVVLKGLNRRSFEDKLMSNVNRRVSKCGNFRVYSKQSTIYVEPKDDECDIEAAFESCKKIFGIIAVSKALPCEKDIQKIISAAKNYLACEMRAARSFKVESKRADKTFPLTSIQISQQVGGALHQAFPTCEVNVHDPGARRAYRNSPTMRPMSTALLKRARAALPIGMGGVAVSLLSGGIDSPVSSYMIAKRGVKLEMVHFFSPPYTSDEAKEKVLSLAKLLVPWCGRLTVQIVPFTEIQEEIRRNCPEEFFTLIMRRFMMRIAERVAVEYGCGALITGESLGQVASQTMPAMAVTGAVCDLPVFRPCIGMDKEEIVTIARKIDTFETSILPYEDCCTVFTPKHPNTKPKMPKILEAESHLDVEALVDEAVKGVEIIHLP